MISAYVSGMGLGASLIVAIGAQNAFVLVQAIRREHHFVVAGICAVLDALLIGAGVLGVGGFVASSQVLRVGAGVGGALFLFWFGLNALRTAFTLRKMDISLASFSPRSLKKTIVALLAVSLLNPHVYLDTVIMLGAISGNYEGNGRYLFGLGAATSSVLWFFTLAFCGTLLAPVFAKPRAWQVLNVVVCAMVWLVAARLSMDVWGEFFPAGAI